MTVSDIRHTLLRVTLVVKKKKGQENTCQHNLTLFSISMISQILNSLYYFRLKNSMDKTEYW